MKLRQLSFEAFDRLAPGHLVPVYRQLRADTETPISAFLKLRSPARGFMLESLAGGQKWGRFSFLGDRPSATLRFSGRSVVVEQDGRRVSTEEDRPLDAIRRFLSRRKLAHVEGMPRFVGGLVGYLSYDAVRWFEPRVPCRLGPDPVFPESEWMAAERLIAFDNVAHQVTLVRCADASRHRTSRAAYRRAVEELDELEEALGRPLPRQTRPAPVKGLRDAWDRQGFVDAVARAREYIAAGDCMQVVLSRRVTGRYAGDPFELYRRLRTIEPAPYAFYLCFGERSLFGASPELLVRCEEGTVTVRPIAGTRPRGATPAADVALEGELRADPKERAEHVMLVDLGRNDVGRVAEPGSVRIEAREVVERYARVMHLVSEVSGKLRRGLDALDALAAAFPAGTVTGAPKVRAMEIIDELEPAGRGPYAGAAGFIGFDGSMDLAIAIRSVALSGRELRVQAGAGIVYDSVPEREHEETSHKMAAILAALGADPLRQRDEPARTRRRAPASLRQGRRGS